MATSNEPPLDEIQWSHPQLAAMHGIHDNSVLHYFSESPFFDRTSNNAVLANQAQFNPNMVSIIQTREKMEAHLRTMSGLEYMVAEKPREMGQGAVWVINKQTRRKRPGEEDEITVHAAYFVVGINVYMAPTLADILSSRIVGFVLGCCSVTDGLTRDRRRYQMPLPRFSRKLRVRGPGLRPWDTYTSSLRILT
jgi:mediator of RNA polymerase II transcription subunit 6